MKRKWYGYKNQKFKTIGNFYTKDMIEGSKIFWNTPKRISEHENIIIFMNFKFFMQKIK